jgi:hypothetical protein
MNFCLRRGGEALRGDKERVMISKAHVAAQTAALLLPALLYAVPAGAQDSNDAGASGHSAASSNRSAAPVGHRQPTAADVANEKTTKTDEEREKRERALDKKLQICRGC